MSHSNQLDPPRWTCGCRRRRRRAGGGAQRMSEARHPAAAQGGSPPWSRAWTTRSSRPWSPGIESQASAGGTQVTVQAANSITDTTGQADKLNGLAGQDFKCFIVNPITGTNLIQGIAQLSAKNIPIVNIDSPIDAGAAKAANAKIATYIGTDNADAGAQAAAEMAKLLPQGGTVALIGGTSGDVTSAARLDGFTKARARQPQDHARPWLPTGNARWR